MAYKLVCFDLDGTLIDNTNSIWETVHKAIGTDGEDRRKVMQDFLDGRISYKEWADIDVAAWKKAGLSMRQLKGIIDTFTPMKGAYETLSELKKRGIKTAVISGSLKMVLDHFFKADDFDHVFINDLKWEDEKLDSVVSCVNATMYDQHGKAEALELVCKKEGISIHDAAFIGDHNNDVEIAKVAGLSIAFNCKSKKLREVADLIIEEKDLRLILPHII